MVARAVRSEAAVAWLETLALGRGIACCVHGALEADKGVAGVAERSRGALEQKAMRDMQCPFSVAYVAMVMNGVPGVASGLVAGGRLPFVQVEGDVGEAPGRHRRPVALWKGVQ